MWKFNDTNFCGTNMDGMALSFLYFGHNGSSDNDFCIWVCRRELWMFMKEQRMVKQLIQETLQNSRMYCERRQREAACFVRESMRWRQMMKESDT